MSRLVGPLLGGRERREERLDRDITSGVGGGISWGGISWCGYGSEQGCRVSQLWQELAGLEWEGGRKNERITHDEHAGAGPPVGRFLWGDRTLVWGGVIIRAWLGGGRGLS